MKQSNTDIKDKINSQAKKKQSLSLVIWTNFFTWYLTVVGSWCLRSPGVRGEHKVAWGRRNRYFCRSDCSCSENCFSYRRIGYRCRRYGSRCGYTRMGCAWCVLATLWKNGNILEDTQTNSSSSTLIVYKSPAHTGSDIPEK